MTVLSFFVLHMSAVLTSFPFPVVFKFCVLFFFLNKITLGCFAFCFFSEEQTAGAESVDPQPAPWHASSGRDVPECRTQQTPVPSLFRGPSIPCLDMTVFITLCLSLAMLSQSNSISIQFSFCHQNWKMKEQIDGFQQFRMVIAISS